jgi:hypothetical protein
LLLDGVAKVSGNMITTATGQKTEYFLSPSTQHRLHLMQVMQQKITLLVSLLEYHIMIRYDSLISRPAGIFDMTTVKDEAKTALKTTAPAKSKVATKPAVAAAVTNHQAERVLKPLHTASSLKALSAAVPRVSMGKTDLYSIEPDLLQVRPNWNSRGAFLSLEEFLALPMRTLIKLGSQYQH